MVIVGVLVIVGLYHCSVSCRYYVSCHYCGDVAIVVVFIVEAVLILEVVVVVFSLFWLRLLLWILLFFHGCVCCCRGMFVLFVVVVKVVMVVMNSVEFSVVGMVTVDLWFYLYSWSLMFLWWFI